MRLAQKGGEVVMNTEPELLNERLERLAMVLDEIMPQCALLVRDTIELLKEQENEINYLKKILLPESGHENDKDELPS